MYSRTNYEMTEADLNKILDACKPVPCMLIGGVMPRSQQDNANAAWAELGKRMGFDHMTVQPAPGGDRCFTAVPSETEEHRERRLKDETETKRLAEIARLEGEILTRQEELSRLQEQEQ